MNEASTADFASPLGARQPLALTWRHPEGMLALSVVNYVLRVLTLGFYNFWGKTEVRKRIWSAVRIEGEPLHYTGTGGELCLGFLIIFGAVVIPLMLLSVGVALAFGPESAAFDVYQLLAYGFILFLTGVGVYRAQRYRLSRTVWRGIRGGLVGSDRHYAWTYVWTAALIPFTLGWIVPWRATRLQELMTRDMQFGNRPLSFTARSRPLYVPFALLWIIVVALAVASAIVISLIVSSDFARADIGPNLSFALSAPAILAIIGVLLFAYAVYAVASSWYRARQINHYAAHTHFSTASFHGRVTAGGLMWISVTNLLIVILSLGLLIPVAQARAARYMVEHLSIVGSVALGEIFQGADQGIRRGEGLAQAFDVDAF